MRLLRTLAPQFATLRAGEALLLDSRVLHCGAANVRPVGAIDGDRALFYVSFIKPGARSRIGGRAPTCLPTLDGALTLAELRCRTDPARPPPKPRPVVRPSPEFLAVAASLAA